MKSLCFAVCAFVAAVAFAEDPFWKDGVAPDLTRPSDSTDTKTIDTAVEGRPYVCVQLDGLNFRSVLAPGFLLFFR